MSISSISMKSLFSKKSMSVALSILAIGGLSFAFSPSAEAKGINFHQRHQAGRIHQGFRNGQLTRREAHGLIAQQRHINHVEHRYRGDGYMSPRERARLNAMQNRSSHSIYNQKHDGQYRY